MARRLDKRNWFQRLLGLVGWVDRCFYAHLIAIGVFGLFIFNVWLWVEIIYYLYIT